MYIVTGGAGFIGSNIAAALEERGDDVVIVDWLGTEDKWRNIAKRRRTRRTGLPGQPDQRPPGRPAPRKWPKDLPGRSFLLHARRLV